MMTAAGDCAFAASSPLCAPARRPLPVGTEACARTPFAASASALSSNGGGTQSWGGVPMSATPAKSLFRHDQYASPRTTGRQAEESRGSPRRFAVTLGQGKGDVEAQPRRVGRTPTPVAVVGRCGAVSVGLCWPRHRPFLTGHGQRVPRLRQAYRQGCPGGRGTGCGVQGRARPPAASLACRPRGARRVVSRVCRVGAPGTPQGAYPYPPARDRDVMRLPIVYGFQGLFSRLSNLPVRGANQS